jgi:predicted DNA binding protein
MATYETEQPDLWSAANKPEDVRSPSQRRLLPHDLDVALKYLTDGELAALAKAVEQEKLRRSPELAAKIAATQKPAPQRQITPIVEGLTQSQVNLIRSSVKAGVKPATLSRQFGLSRAQITAALKSAK